MRTWLQQIWRKYYWMSGVVVSFFIVQQFRIMYKMHETRAHYWDVPPKALWQVASQRLAGEQGIVLPLFDDIALLGASLIKELRDMNVDLPVEVPHCGDLSAEHQTLLTQLDDETHVYDVCELAAQASHAGRQVFCIDLEHCHELFRSFNIKILGVAYSTFHEVMLLDADTMFFTNPMALWNTTKYNESGIVLFPDRIVRRDMYLAERNWLGKGPSGLHHYLSTFAIEPFRELETWERPLAALMADDFTPPLKVNPSQFLLTSHSWNLRAGHQTDSSVVLWNKRMQPRATALLASFVALNGKARPPSFGDKELFFVAAELAETRYTFSDYGVGAVGHEVSDRMTRLCGDALHFFPEFNPNVSNPENHGVPFYINSDNILNWDPDERLIVRTISRAASAYPGSEYDRHLRFQCAFDIQISKFTLDEAKRFTRRQRIHLQLQRLLQSIKQRP